MNNIIIIIADDLTGAADTAVQFSPFFEETTLNSHRFAGRVLEAARLSSSRAAALYTNSRALPADAANPRLVAVAQKLAGENPPWIYKKIDSCMRGNVGAEADALLDELNYDVSFITPSFPEMGRTTRGDIHLVHEVPLNQTEISRDPVTPVKESQVSVIVQSQSRHPVGHIGLETLEASRNHMIQEVENRLLKGVRHIVFDVAGRYHLDRIAHLIFLLERKILPVGSAGLGGSIAKHLKNQPASDKLSPVCTHKGCNLIVCGTASAVTEQQMDQLLQTYAYELILLSPAVLADQNRKDELSEILPDIQSQLLQDHVILKLASQQNGSNASRQTIFQNDAASIVSQLGRMVADVVAVTKPANLFLTGGDTADAVLTAVEAEGIRILGEVVAGVVQGVITGGILNGLPVVTKAGAFGEKNTLVEIHEYWMRK